MHSQENTLFDLKATHKVAQYILYHVTYTLVKFEVATSKCLKEDAVTRKYII